ncbi:MAG TPA: hypothetical protein VFS76_19855 [Pyrinomonadaceae bacterium]|nr:hypothetical protein [Pyrinomonadaceae bacterium]
MNLYKRGLFFIGLLLLVVPSIHAQHEGHQQPPPKPAGTPATPKPTSPQPSPETAEANTEKTSLAIGSDLTFYSKPSILDSVYGTNPVSWKIFFRLRPAKMNMSGMHGTH